MRVWIVPALLLLALLGLHRSEARAEPADGGAYMLAQAEGDDENGAGSAASVAPEETETPAVKKKGKKDKQKTKGGNRGRRPKGDDGKPPHQATAPVKAAQPQESETEEVEAQAEEQVTSTGEEETGAAEGDDENGAPAEEGGTTEDEGGVVPEETEGGDDVAAENGQGSPPGETQETDEGDEAIATDGEEGEAVADTPQQPLSPAVTAPDAQTAAPALGGQATAAPGQIAATMAQGAQAPARKMLIVPKMSPGFLREMARRPRGVRRWTGFGATGGRSLYEDYGDYGETGLDTTTAVPDAGAAPLPEGPTPDLIISDLYADAGELRFRVKNIGDAPKEPGEVHYVATLTRVSASGKSLNASYGGLAGAASEALLAPGQEAGEDRASGYGLDLTGASSFTICVNLDGKVPERNRANNCLTRPSGDDLPDLHLRDGTIALHPPGENDSCGCALTRLWQCLPGSCAEENESGEAPANEIRFTVENTGVIPLAHYEVGVEVKENGRTVFSEVMIVDDLLAPGETKEILIPWGNRDAGGGSRYERPDAISGVATADPNRTMLEVNRRNNSLVIKAHRAE